MSSWSGSNPHPPRGDRSRSPSRGAYGRPYADHPYQPDPYAREWDYGRERMWQDWERERVPYEYGRRHRSRSPQYDDGLFFLFLLVNRFSKLLLFDSPSWP